ncbi:MAG: outer membrane beta-barrel protein [Acidobacteriota bacterium]|nr:outer membrane beta-barrel protein [Acidobacteriota bacterium]
MNRIEILRRPLLLLTACVLLAPPVLLPMRAAAQSQHPTAVQLLELSAFGGVSGVFTGLSGGKNLGVTAGLDLALPPMLHVRPVLEARGTYPVDKGVIDSQRSVLGGVRVNFMLGHRIRPYADFLFGRGQMNYGKGYFYRNSEYELTTTWVYSPGAGFDYELTPHFSAKVDAQYQRWGSAPVDGGTIYSKQGTIGLVYTFDFNRHGIH